MGVGGWVADSAGLRPISLGAFFYVGIIFTASAAGSIYIYTHTYTDGDFAVTTVVGRGAWRGVAWRGPALVPSSFFPPEGSNVSDVAHGQ